MMMTYAESEILKWRGSFGMEKELLNGRQGFEMEDKFLKS